MAVFIDRDGETTETAHSKNNRVDQDFGFGRIKFQVFIVNHWRCQGVKWIYTPGIQKISSGWRYKFVGYQYVDDI